MSTSLFETSLVAKELKIITEKHTEIVQQIKEVTEHLRTKNEELNRLKEHGLILTGAKSVLEGMEKTLKSQDSVTET